MDNPYAAPQRGGGTESSPAVEGPSRAQDLALVRTWLGQSGFVILGISGAAGVLTSLLLDLQAFYMPESGSSMMGLVNTVLMIIVSMSAIHIAVGRWRDPKAPLGPMISRGFQTGGRAVLPLVLRGFALIIGLIFFVVPGVIVGVRTLMIHGMFALGYRDEGVKSLKHAWERSEGQSADLFVLVVLGTAPLIFMSLLEGAWQYVAYEQGLGIGMLLAASLPLAFIRAFVSTLLPLLGAARVIGWIREDQGELSFPWEQ